MNIFALMAIVNLLFSLVIGLLVLFQNPRKRVFQTFFLMNLAIAVWSFGYFFWQISISYDEALFWVRFFSIGSTLVPPFFLHWSLSILNLDIKKSKTILFFYILSFAFLLFSFSNSFIYGLTENKFFEFWPVPGVLYTIYLFFSYIPIVIYSHVILFKEYKQSYGVKRSRLRWVAWGSALSFLGGSTNFPMWYGVEIPPFLNFMVASYPIFFGYSISRYRLMDLRSVLTRSITFGFLVVSITSIFAIFSSLLGSLFGSFAGVKSNIFIGLVVGFFVTVFYNKIVRFFEKATNKFLFKKSYDQDKLLAETSDIAARYIQMDRLSGSIYKVLDEAFHFEKFGISLLESDGSLKIIYKKGFKVNEAEKLVAYPDIATIFAKELQVHKGPLAIEEMITRYENKEFEPVDANLLKVVHHNNIAVAIPLYVKNNLIGMMVLGSKKSGDPYTQQDINVLEIIGGQMAVAIDNARLYEELRYFNLKLEEEVREKTKQLRVANEDLQKLDRAKSEFISIASHQLRTPLTVIKGYISMMKEGSFGPIRPKILQNLEKVYVSNERLITLVENLLDISRIESGRQEFAWKKIQLEDLAAEVTEKLQDSARKKKLKLAFHNPSEKLPPVIVDDGKIHEVMMNFVDNAVKYTDKGKVDVFVKKEKEFITFCVKDTGKGISEEGKKKLFQKFSRGKDSFRQHTEGLGLGLYVATMMMKAHGGRIWADSPGEGMGSEFCFSIPVKSNHKDGEVSKIDERVVQEANEQEKKEVLAE